MRKHADRVEKLNGRCIMKKAVIGIMPQARIRERVLAIARGEYKPRKNEPKIWFPSMKSVAEVLSDNNCAFLKMIAAGSQSR
jgi:predicted transcriptional regulator